MPLSVCAASPLCLGSAYYARYVIFPTVMMAMMGWLSFFIDRRAVPARVTLPVVSFLVILTQIWNEMASVGKVRAQGEVVGCVQVEPCYL